MPHQPGHSAGDQAMRDAAAERQRQADERTRNPVSPQAQQAFLGGSQGAFTAGQFQAQRGARQGEVAAGQAAGLGVQSRTAQSQLISQLQAQASGQAPSLAALQQQQGIAQASQQAAGFAAGQRGNPLLAARQAAQIQGDLAARGAVQGGQLRLQEQMAAQAALGGTLQGVRGQDLAQQQAARQQQQAMLGLGQQAQMAQLGASQQGNLATLGSQNQALDRGLSREQLAQQQRQFEAQQRMQLVGAIASGAGGVLGAAVGSDERIKENIEGGGDAVRDLLENMRPVEYSYRADSGERGGRHVGVLAQDVGKSRAGSAIVREEQSGTKVLDVQRVLSALLASSAHLHGRLKGVEARG